MKDNENQMRNEMAEGLNKSSGLKKILNLAIGNKKINCNEIINNFKSMLEDYSLIEKIKNNDELRKRVCEVHDMIEYNHINEK